MTFLRAFFEGRLFDQKLLDQMTRWSPIFFPLRYGCGLMYFRLPRFFWPRPPPRVHRPLRRNRIVRVHLPSRSFNLAGTVNQISPSRRFFLMITLARAASQSDPGRPVPPHA